MGAFMGIAHVITETIEIDDGVYQSRCELRRLSDGMVIGSGEGICGTQDDGKGAQCWAKRPRPHRSSMSQTRAIVRAYSNTFRWVMEFAGDDYTGTPYEDMHGAVIDGEVVDATVEYSFRVPVCYEHNSDAEKAIPLVWKEGSGPKGDFAFWGCPYYQDEGCLTSSNAPGPDEQDLAEAYWHVIDAAAAAGTDLSISYIEKGFTKSMLGDELYIKDLVPRMQGLIIGYYDISTEKLPLPEVVDDQLKRKAFARGVVKYALGKDIDISASLKDVSGLITSGELVVARVKKDGKTNWEVVKRSDVDDAADD
jgi:hypothetical protein